MEIEELLRKLKPVLGEEEVAGLWRSLQLADPGVRRILEADIRLKAERLLGLSFEEREILFEPPPAETAAGPFTLGTVHYGRQPLHPFGLRPEELIQHVAIFGRTGAGKTNVGFLLVRELLKAGIPVTVCDWKRNYRDLVALPEFSALEVLTVGRDEAPFFFNPLIPPPATPPAEWLKQLAAVMCHVYFLGHGVAYLLQEELDALYRAFGVYEGSGHWPTLADLLVRLRARATKGREAGWMESTLRAVGTLCFGATGWVLTAGANTDLAALLRRPVVLELDALDHDDKTFLVESLLLWIHQYRMAEPGREQLKHVILLEEAHHVLLGEKQGLTGGEAVPELVLRQIRELGEAVVILDQEPSRISKSALANTYATVALNLKEQADVTTAARSMLLDTEGGRKLGLLPVGWALVKLQARWPRPFLVSFPLLQVAKGTVSNEDLHKRFLDRLTAAECLTLIADLWGPIERQFRSVAEAAGAPRPTGPRSQTGCTPIELQLLQDVRDHPVDPVSIRYRRLGLSFHSGRKLVSALQERELLGVVDVPVPEGRITLLELTTTGWAALGLAPQSSRFGGKGHDYWKKRIAKTLRERGFTVREEVPLGGGKTVDLVAAKDGREAAIEVETGCSDIAGNVEKCVEAGYDRVLVAVTEREPGDTEAHDENVRKEWAAHGAVVRVVWVGDLVRGKAGDPDTLT